MAQGLQYYDITVPTNSVMGLSAPGKYFRFYTGEASGMDATITLKSNNSGVMCLLKPGQSIKLPEGVTDWYIGNYANQAPITGIVVVGDGEIVDTNVAGSVSIIDGGISRTLAQQAFLGQVGCSAVAAQFAHCQLWNPIGSGKNLIVEAVSFSSSVAQYITLARDNIARISAGSLSANKLLGGAAGVGLIKFENNAVSQYVAPYFLQYLVNAGVVNTINFKEPVIIQPGNGFNLLANTVNTFLIANFEFFEQ